MAFMLSPPALYFEHLYLYEWPVVTLLVLAAIAFHRACLRPTTLRWLLFFVLCAAIAVTRSTFHMVWLALLIGAAVAASGRSGRRAAIVGALPGVMLVVALYAKNAVVFGEFAASTFGPASFHLVTVDRMPPAERDQWMAEGTLSPFAAVSPYAPPRDYLPYFATSDPAGLLRSRDSITSRCKAPNFNHWFILEAQRARRHDVADYLRASRWDTCAMSGRRPARLFGPTTEWHPRTGTAGLAPCRPSPAARTATNAAITCWSTSWCSQPFGVYVLLTDRPDLGGVAGDRSWRGGEVARRRARGALLAFCVFQIVFVVAVSSMATFLESSRYRFQVEPFIWILWRSTLVSLTHGRLSDRRHL